MISVAKMATLRTGFRRTAVPFNRARDAFRQFLVESGVQRGESILIPSFIGWSSREGSGVFDPITELGITPVFYRLDKSLRIDVVHLEDLIASSSSKVLLIIHYFGYVDPSARQAMEIARNNGLLVMEDSAHAMLTDLIGGACGRDCDATIYSLHKILPVPSGGVLVWNGNQPDSDNHISANQFAPLQIACFGYDLYSIAQIRRQNALLIYELLAPLADYVEPLWGPPGSGEVPQTFPVVIKTVSRDQLYFDMNDRGFGVTSLYHTMIPEIDADEFPESHGIAKRIMNLPVHQDATEDGLRGMISALKELVS